MSAASPPPEETSDDDLAPLLARMALGDRVAFHTLYRRTSARLFGVVLRIQKDRGVAEDVLQEVYVNVWRATATYDVRMGQPLTWLRSIARNKAIDSLRRAKGTPATVTSGVSMDDEPFDPLDLVASESPGPLELLEQAADRTRLAHCMQTLSREQRQSLALAYYQGLSHGEIAQQLMQPLGTVKSWVRRGLGALRDCLERAAAVRT